MRRRWAVLLLAGLWGPGREAGALAPDDFAYGFVLRTEGKAPLWEVSLPEPVYRGIVRADLGDLRVFDAGGSAQPCAVGRPAAPKAEAAAPIPLPFFPIYTTAEVDPVGRALEIITDDAGRIVDARSRTFAREGAERVGAYLLDASALDTPVKGLDLSWEAGGVTFVSGLRVEASDDLTRWHTEVPTATVADLRSGGQHLTQRHVELPAARAKYFRLSWPSELREVTLVGVRAVLPEPKSVAAREWTLTQGRPDPDPRLFDFDLGGYWPTDRVRLSFSEAGNTLLQGILESRPGPNSPWMRRYQGLFYSLQTPAGTVHSGVVDVPATTDRFWRLEISAEEGVPSGTAPSLEVGWTPLVLTFLAQGNPPFTLAYGSARVGPAEQPVDALLRTLAEANTRDLVRSAVVAEAVTLGGEERRHLPAPLPWKRWALWLVLGAGLLLLAWMVLRLYRQMSGVGPSSTGPT